MVDNITVNAPGLKFKKEMSTVIASASGSTITLDSHPDEKISLGDFTAKQLGLKKGLNVTVAPASSEPDGKFVITPKVGAVKAAVAKVKDAVTPKKGTGSSPSLGYKPSNILA